MTRERGTPPEPLGPADATLWCATTPLTQLQIGALCRFEGGPLRDADGALRIDETRRHVEDRLRMIPRFRQRIQRVAFDLGRPVWVDEADFDIDRHVRATTLPAPGDDAALRRFVGDLLGRPLDPDHSPWDLWLVDGLEGGDVAVVLRTDHVLADGLSLLRAAMALLDLEAMDPTPESSGNPAPEPWRPRRPPGAIPLAVRGVIARGRGQVGLAAGAIRAALDPRHAYDLARSAVRSVTASPLAPSVPLNGRIGPHRDFLWASLPIGQLRTVAHAHDATLNDVLLAVVTGALRQLLGAPTAESLAGHQPKVLVPVGDTVEGSGGNAFSFVVTELPVHLDDPHATLAAVRDAMRNRKDSRQAADLVSLFSVVDLIPIALLRHVAPELLARQPLVNLAVTNIPGSDAPLYLRGARLQAVHPIVSGVGNIACIVGALSYTDRLHVGITIDPDVVHDAQLLLDGMIRAARDLYP